MRNKVLVLAAVAVAVFVAVWSINKPKQNPSVGVVPQDNRPISSNNSADNTAQAVGTVSGNTLAGTLKNSNITAKGNLMLVTDTQTLYIRTSRDYSGLVNKEVNVVINGNVNNFTLVDIVARVGK
jgi:hypothetical protein